MDNGAVIAPNVNTYTITIGKKPTQAMFYIED